MIKKILSISGKPGLYRLISQGKNMLIVETLGTGKRMPVYPHEKVVSLGDISIYTTEEDVPLAEVLEKVAEKAGRAVVDVKAIGDEKAIRAYFGEILPNFDDDRVYTTDIKKLLSWYNILVNNGITEFVEPKKVEDAPAEEVADANPEA